MPGATSTNNPAADDAPESARSAAPREHPAPALQPDERQAMTIAKIMVSLPLPPLPMLMDPEGADGECRDELQYKSDGGRVAISHDVLAQLMLHCVLLGSAEANSRRQERQQQVLADLTREVAPVSYHGNVSTLCA